MSLTQLYARYRKRVSPSILHLQNTEGESLSLEDQWLKKYSMAIPLWFQGVFDTVGALGVPFGNIPIISRSNYGFLETDLRINDSRAYHAVAIDEHREAFAPTLWTKSVLAGAGTPTPRSLEDVEQRWFVGAHADVGGGYPDGLLAQIPLVWLMQKARLHGLVFKGTAFIDGDENQDGRRLRRYERRWIVERFAAGIRWQRRLVVRWEYHPVNFLAFLQLAALCVLLKHF
jgi:uncharacterized protein (DUF2235 family)